MGGDRCPLYEIIVTINIIITIIVITMITIREWVVTAAHCMRGENREKLRVVLGELDRRDQFETENR